MDEPSKFLLVVAFLAQTLRDANAETNPDRLTYEQLAEQWGVNPTSLKRLANGQSTIGAELIYRIADRRWEHSVDAMGTAARSWWLGMTPKRRAEIAEWISKTQQMRRGRGVQAPEDAAEVERYRSETSIATREAPAASPSVRPPSSHPRLLPPSGRNRHQR